VALYRDRGVVLRTIKLGETDRIVTIFSQGHGKIRGVAKGVRKPGSRFGGRLEPTLHILFQCYEGRELDIVTQVETIEAFRPVREGYGSLTHSVSMLEAVDQVVHQEREPVPSIYRMLVGALREMSERPSPLVAPAFFWKLLSLEGFHPILDHCARCGTEEPPFLAFNIGEGGVVCTSCAELGGIRIQPDTLELLRWTLQGELSRVLAEPPSDVTLEVERLAVASLEYHLERRLRSAALL